MIVPLTSLQLQLIQLLMDKNATPELLVRLRKVLITMYLSNEISEAFFDKSMVDLQIRCGTDPQLNALHQETTMLFNQAKAKNGSQEGS